MIDVVRLLNLIGKLWKGCLGCCAQQTGMHKLVVEALLIAIYSTWGRANTYRHKKTLSVENLSRANSWSLSSCGVRACESQPKRGLLATLASLD
jgi:hypothetical protein